MSTIKHTRINWPQMAMMIIASFIGALLAYVVVVLVFRLYVKSVAATIPSSLKTLDQFDVPSAQVVTDDLLDDDDDDDADDEYDFTRHPGDFYKPFTSAQTPTIDLDSPSLSLLRSESQPTPPQPQPTPPQPKKATGIKSASASAKKKPSGGRSKTAPKSVTPSQSNPVNNANQQD